jgi:hypothetical protein
MASETPKQTTARAIVQLTVEVESDGAWGPECAIGQLQKQAAESATSKIRFAFGATKTRFRFIGEPKVQSIITEG